MSRSTEGSPELQAWTIRLIIAICLGGVLVAISYQTRNQRVEAHSERPAYLSKIERDFEAVNIDGVSFPLSQLKGKVFVGAYLSSLGKEASDQVAKDLEALRQEFSDNAHFAVVGFGVDPVEDTPESTTAFLQRLQVPPDQWVFLTDTSGQLITELSRYRGFRFLRPRPVDDPEKKALIGPWQYDARIALVDGKANIRGYYRFLDPELGDAFRAQIRKDIQYLLNEVASPQS